MSRSLKGSGNKGLSIVKGLLKEKTVCVHRTHDVLAGIEYSGFRDTTLSFEAANRHLFDFDENLKQIPERAEENELQTVLRLTRKFRHGMVALTALSSTFGLFGEDGGFQRLSVKGELFWITSHDTMSPCPSLPAPAVSSEQVLSSAP